MSERWEHTGLEVLRTADFEGEHLRRRGVYVVCFGAKWCLPTRIFVPKFVSQNAELPPRSAIVDISDLKDPLWDVFRIRITPSILIFHEGENVARYDGRRVVGLRSADLQAVAGDVRRLAASPRSGSAA